MRKNYQEKTIYRLHAQICQTLSNPTRIEIIDVLQDKEVSAGEIAKEIGVSKSNLSQHLSVLREKGVVQARKDGANVFYCISNPKVTQACRLMREVLFDRLNQEKNLVNQIKKMQKNK